MEVIGYLYGGGGLIKRYQAGTTITNRGIQILGSVDAATDIGSVEPGTASTAVNVGSQVGINLDITGTITGTAAATSQTADLLVSVEVRPDAIIKAKMSGGTASDTALTIETTTATSTGVDATGCTTFDNGACWGYSGANVGEYRKTDDTAGSFSISMPTAVAVGDRFIAVNGYPCSVELTNFECWDLTTELDQLLAQTVITNMDNFACFDIDPKAADDDGENNSYFHLIANNHLFGSSSLA
jgi:hypothetical protein